MKLGGGSNLYQQFTDKYLIVRISVTHFSTSLFLFLSYYIKITTVLQPPLIFSQMVRDTWISLCLISLFVVFVHSVDACIFDSLLYLTKQDHLDLISMVLEGALEAEKEKTLRLEESHRAAFVALVEKERERSMLITKNRDLVANEAPKAKFVERFMVFIEAIENDDLETLQSFDEKTMMNTILTMMNCDGENGGKIK